MIKRTLTHKLKSLASKFPVVAVAGPRQSGKTTLVKQAFPDFDYVSLEDLDVREYAQKDSRAFLADHPGPAILDEVQRVPTLFSYLQTHVDTVKGNGKYVLTGSQNILLQSHVSQTLAGRAAYVTLLPFSLEELEGSRFMPKSLDTCLFKGSYPRLYDQKIAPADWFPNYLRTYVEREVRLIKNITDLGAFQKFIRLCAGRTGQLLNLASLANDCGIAANTAGAWLSILEASYIIFLLRPYHANISKRLVKAPKLYFHDTGLACALLGIKNTSQVRNHYLRGSLFETWMVSEVMKFHFHRGREPVCYFLRDKLGREIDCLIENGKKSVMLEAKSGATPADDFFSNYHHWDKVFPGHPAAKNVVYGGNTSQKRSRASLVGWKDFPGFLCESLKS